MASSGIIALILVFAIPLVIFLLIFIPIRIHIVRKRKNPDQKLTLKMKELELKEKELELKEKELSDRRKK